MELRAPAKNSRPMMAKMVMANMRRRAMLASGPMALMMELITTCKPERKESRKLRKALNKRFKYLPNFVQILAKTIGKFSPWPAGKQDADST